MIVLCDQPIKIILASKSESLQMLSEIGLLSMATAIIEKRAAVVRNIQSRSLNLQRIKLQFRVNWCHSK